MRQDESVSELRGDLRVGVSPSLTEDDWEWPIHGMRHPPERQSSGWYLWTGNLNHPYDYFQPLRTHELLGRIPELTPLLDLPAGTRFVSRPGRTDSWDDPTLLDL
jgi:hypothetical protein